MRILKNAVIVPTHAMRGGLGLAMAIHTGIERHPKSGGIPTDLGSIHSEMVKAADLFNEVGEVSISVRSSSLI